MTNTQENTQQIINEKLEEITRLIAQATGRKEQDEPLTLSKTINVDTFIHQTVKEKPLETHIVEDTINDTVNDLISTTPAYSTEENTDTQTPTIKTILINQVIPQPKSEKNFGVEATNFQAMETPHTENESIQSVNISEPVQETKLEKPIVLSYRIHQYFTPPQEKTKVIHAGIVITPTIKKIHANIPFQIAQENNAIHEEVVITPPITAKQKTIQPNYKTMPSIKKAIKKTDKSIKANTYFIPPISQNNVQVAQKKETLHEPIVNEIQPVITKVIPFSFKKRTTLNIKSRDKDVAPKKETLHEHTLNETQQAITKAIPASFKTHTTLNLDPSYVDKEESLKFQQDNDSNEQLSKILQLMYRYALINGLLDTVVVAEIQHFFSNKRNLVSSLKLYRMLEDLIYPVTPATLEQISSKTTNDNLIFFKWWKAAPFFSLFIIFIVSTLVLCIVSIPHYLPYMSLTKLTITDLIGCIAAGSLGASLYGLLKLEYHILKRSYQIEMQLGAWVDYVLGLTLGSIIGFILLISHISVMVLNPWMLFALAGLFGFTSVVIFVFFMSILRGIVAIFNGNDADSILWRKQKKYH